LGEKDRDPERPSHCDACFTGDYPTSLTDQDEVMSAGQLKLHAVG
jgi:amidophosphoribosyltransferase